MLIAMLMEAEFYSVLLGSDKQNNFIVAKDVWSGVVQDDPAKTVWSKLVESSEYKTKEVSFS